jgi:Tfp pilus assembly protein PilF
LSIRVTALCGLPVVAALLVHGGTLRGEFVHDDTLQIVQNPWVKELRYLPRVVTRSVWAFRTSQATNYYRPVQMGLYNLLWVGSGGNPHVFHLANLALHLGTTAALALVIRRLSGDPLLACGASSVFAVHPVNTEAVAWIACVPELTYSLFVLLALLLHVGSWRPATRRRGLRRWGAVGLFLLALFSKETAIVLIGLVVLLELWLRPGRPPALRERGLAAAGAVAPFVLVAAIYVAVRFSVLRGFAPLVHNDLTPFQALINAPPLFLDYVRTLLVPVQLLAHHVFDPLPSMLDPRLVLGVATIALVGALVVVLARRRPDLAFAGALAVLPLAPVLYVPALGSNAFAERYAYLPAAGMAWLVVGGLFALAAQVAGAARGPRAALAAALVLAAPLSVMAARRNRDWLTTERLAQATLRAEPRATHFWAVLGNWYEEQGRPEDALRTYEEGLAAVPGSVPLRANQLNLGLQLGRITPDEAVARLEELDIARQPLLYELHAVLGDALLAARRFPEAESAFRRAVELNPHDPLLHNRLAVVLVESGRMDEARRELQRALAIDPTFELARDNLARLDALAAAPP